MTLSLKSSADGERSEDMDALKRSLHQQEVFSDVLQDTADIVVAVHALDGTLLSLNRYGRWLTGIDHPETADLSFLQLLDNPRPELATQLGLLIQGQRSVVRDECALSLAQSEPLLMSWWHSVCEYQQGKAAKILSIGTDISDQRLAEEHLNWLALHDPLTGLLNRRGFMDSAHRLLASGLPFSLFLLDLDKFKDLNDLSGHHLGDRLLHQVAQVLVQQLPAGITIARLGGDEFGLLLPRSADENPETLAALCCRSVQQIVPIESIRNLDITVSIGIVNSPEHGQDVDGLVSDADIALYEAKARGRNSWFIFDGDSIHRSRIHERLYWQQQIRQLLQEQRIDIHYQPILNLDTRLVTHYEALLRGVDENCSPLNTGDLINAAEQSGMIEALDERIVEQVFSQSGRLRREGRPARIAINLSGRSFSNANLATHIRHCLVKYQVDPSAIIFEITETAAMADIDHSIDMMRTLRELGFSFALDDFGVGFSSLYYLKQLPVDYLKIDGSFVRNLAQDQEHQVLVRALVDVARAFNLHTIAEFVEDSSVLELLATLGVNYAQGYHIERPRAFADIWPH